MAEASTCNERTCSPPVFGKSEWLDITNSQVRSGTLKSYKALLQALQASLLLLTCILPSSTAAQAPICSDRTLILLQGINTKYDFYETTFGDLLQGIGSLYTRVVYYSYDPDNLQAYTREDTFQSISRSVAALAGTVKLEIARCPGVSIDMVGHSLGGLVALTYLGARERDTETASVKHLITLDSPLNGNSQHTIAFLADLYGWDVAESDVAQTLVRVKQDAKRDANIELAERLRRKTVIRTAGSHDDWVVPYEDAVIPGFELELWLGNFLPLDLEDMACRKEEMYSICAGHDQVLRDAGVRSQVRSVLSWSPPVQMTSAEDTTSGVSALVSAGGTLHLVWLSFKSVRVPEGSRTFDRRSIYRQKRVGGEWGQEVVLRGCRFQSPTLVTHPDGSVWIFGGELAECSYRVAGQLPIHMPLVSKGLSHFTYVLSAAFDQLGNLHVLAGDAQNTLAYVMRSAAGIWSRPDIWLPYDTRPETVLLIDARGNLHASYIRDNILANVSIAYYRAKPAGASEWNKQVALADEGKQGEIIDGVNFVSVGTAICALIRSFKPGGVHPPSRFLCTNNLSEWSATERLPDGFRPSYSTGKIILNQDRSLTVVGTTGRYTRLAIANRSPEGVWGRVVQGSLDVGKKVAFPEIFVAQDGRLNIVYSATYGDPDHLEVYIIRSG